MKYSAKKIRVFNPCVIFFIFSNNFYDLMYVIYKYVYFLPPPIVIYYEVLVRTFDVEYRHFTLNYK